MRKKITTLLIMVFFGLFVKAYAQPVVDFISWGTSGNCKQMRFYDSSYCNGCSIASYLWEFGDGTTSSQINPIHNYSSNGNYLVKLTVTSSGGVSRSKSYSTLIPHQNCVDVSITSTRSNCFSEDSCVFLTAIANSGISPHTYSWNTGEMTSTIIVCTLGSYNVQVRDGANKIGSSSITLSSLNKYVVSSSINNAACGTSNGAIAINVSGNNPSLFYSWSNGNNTSSISNLSAGNYSVTINDSMGCEETYSYFIIDSCGYIYGNVFFDENSNGIFDNVEQPFTEGKLETSGGFLYETQVGSNGTYNIVTGNGIFTTNFVPYLNYYTVNPVNHISQIYNSIDSVDFAVTPLPGNPDLEVSIIPLVTPRPGFTARYRVLAKNVGTEVLSGYIRLKIDSRLSIVSSNPNYNLYQGDSIVWEFVNFQPNKIKVYEITVAVPNPPTVNIGNRLNFYAAIIPIDGDLTPGNNCDSIKQVVVGSYDPNDKWVSDDTLTSVQIVTGEYLNYRIRFQNTGTDTAFTVSVIDTLDDNLDWNSLQMINASHNYKLIKRNGNSLEWLFENIMLTDTATNEAESNGYIFFRIKPKSTLSLGDSINNTAGIYFDFNPPIITNTTYTEVLEPLFVNKQKTDNLFGIYPNPANTYLYVDYKNTTPQTILQISDVLGNVVKQQRLQKEIDIKDIANGVYFVKVTDGNKVKVAKFLKE